MTEKIGINEDALKAQRPSKATQVTKLLSRPRGASLGDINNVTAWQAHSIRSFLTGLRKKGLVLAREQRRDGATSYRILKTAPVVPANQVPADD